MSEQNEERGAAGVGIMVAAFTEEEAGEEALKALKKSQVTETGVFRRRGGDPPGR